MSAERKKVLELLATGKITTEEAEKLLNRLDTLAGAERESGPAAVFAEAKPSDSKPPRYLRVEVEKPGSSDNVNVRVRVLFGRRPACTSYCPRVSKTSFTRTASTLAAFHGSRARNWKMS